MSEEWVAEELHPTRKMSDGLTSRKPGSPAGETEVDNIFVLASIVVLCLWFYSLKCTCCVFCELNRTG